MLTLKCLLAGMFFARFLSGALQEHEGA